ncbi:MAG TPA: hypothetical protein VGC22_06030 [Chitinophaga sp.]
MIGIFKTNINTTDARQHIVSALRDRFPVQSCHVDLDDCDKVLRVEAQQLQEAAIIAFVKQEGFECAPLE